MDVCDYVVCYLNRTLKYRLRAVCRGQPKPRQLFFSAYTGKPRRRILLHLKMNLETHVKMRSLPADLYYMITCCEVNDLIRLSEA